MTGLREGRAGGEQDGGDPYAEAGNRRGTDQGRIHVSWWEKCSLMEAVSTSLIIVRLLSFILNPLSPAVHVYRLGRTTDSRLPLRPLPQATPLYRRSRCSRHTRVRPGGIQSPLGLTARAAQSWPEGPYNGWQLVRRVHGRSCG